MTKSAHEWGEAFSCQFVVKNSNQRLRRFGRSSDRSVGDEYEWERRKKHPIESRRGDEVFPIRVRFSLSC